MPAKRSSVTSSRVSTVAHRASRRGRLGRRVALFAIALGLVAAVDLAVVAASSLADTGSVYWDSSASNTAAGRDFFNPTFTGTNNVGIERTVMPSLTSGSRNLAAGDLTLHFDTGGSDNAATGYAALDNNTTGSDNVANGSGALIGN